MAQNPLSIAWPEPENGSLRRQALQAGAFQFLQKPVNKEVLLLAIRNALKTSAQ